MAVWLAAKAQEYIIA